MLLARPSALSIHVNLRQRPARMPASNGNGGRQAAREVLGTFEPAPPAPPALQREERPWCWPLPLPFEPLTGLSFPAPAVSLFPFQPASWLLERPVYTRACLHSLSPSSPPISSPTCCFLTCFPPVKALLQGGTVLCAGTRREDRGRDPAVGPTEPGTPTCLQMPPPAPRCYLAPSSAQAATRNLCVSPTLRLAALTPSTARRPPHLPTRQAASGPREASAL
ncbi:uncharacterized protein LOC130023219 [Sorex fumeus]|uniref:uncharacterized protein LOC130023219 n=1 Tax=Sorex fumeus TaxID=62283 RepID=UPI0024ADE0BC|nr:uncharacterized protein LOC130023219 [Sorex fumeus]